MNIENILVFLGVPVTVQDLQEEFHGIGIDISSELLLPPGDYSAYIERPLNGFSLVFTDEAKFLNIQKQAIGKGPLYFTGIFLYAEGKDDYRQFSFPIPKGLLFSDTSESIHNKLGDPIWNRKRSDGSVISEKWVYPEYIIHITYSGETNTPVIISLNKPDAD